MFWQYTNCSYYLQSLLCAHGLVFHISILSWDFVHFSEVTQQFCHDLSLLEPNFILNECHGEHLITMYSMFKQLSDTYTLFRSWTTRTFPLDSSTTAPRGGGIKSKSDSCFKYYASTLIWSTFCTEGVTMRTIQRETYWQCGSELIIRLDTT